MKNALGNIMQQAQKMQEDFKKAQDELANMQVMGESGGGLVTILMTGKREARKVTIDPSLLGDDKDMLEDLVAAAINDAVNKVGKMKKEKMADITAGLPLPPGFQLPF
ncbi:MAG: YbaB/EbfC family nucleoid-associated protein [Methylococcaceae bacterium]|jgi:nucleoid-associated protein EbfC|nr:YbaB/EbfC family nucleoid-associated protein [Methylococcales bacterium]MDD5115134.1 YbaB/EbfC family nucleoid-associated protein [Methylobacter sp.]MDO9163981.1 YbaB/EbfC family nucleoid-associated protein [Methylococcaceae bacterium]MDP2393541.1 YbaB/EbfC family nucleoid-associated protein [Methylococcaceae bacterium]MDP3020773.1 YbaB/EbfC family nucleoid-associated protein [Methylococcaceae bacterium]